MIAIVSQHFLQEKTLLPSPIFRVRGLVVWRQRNQKEMRDESNEQLGRGRRSGNVDAHRRIGGGSVNCFDYQGVQKISVEALACGIPMTFPGIRHLEHKELLVPAPFSLVKM